MGHSNRQDNKLMPSFKKPMDLEKIQPKLRVMIAEFTQLVRKESQTIELTEQIIRTSVQRNFKDEILKQAKRNAQASSKLSILQSFLNSLNQINNNVNALASSWKQPPSILVKAIQDVIFIANNMRIESFIRFKDVVLKDLYGEKLMSQLMENYDCSAIKEILGETREVTEKEIMECLIGVSKKFFRGDLKPIEHAIGRSISNPQPNNLQGKQQPNLSQNNNQQVKPNVQQVPTAQPQQNQYTPNQQSQQNQYVPNQQPQQNQYVPNQQSQQNQYASNNKTPYQRDPHLYYPIDLPIFSREIWGPLLQIVQESTE